MFSLTENKIPHTHSGNRHHLDRNYKINFILLKPSNKVGTRNLHNKISKMALTFKEFSKLVLFRDKT